MRWKMSAMSGLCALSVTGLLAGCAGPAPRVSDGTDRLGAASPQAVTIYLSPAQVAGPYREIAALVAGRDYPPDGDAYEQMRTRAAALGANAIILDAQQPVQPAPHAAQYVLTAPAQLPPRVVAVVVGEAAFTARAAP